VIGSLRFAVSGEVLSGRGGRIGHGNRVSQRPAIIDRGPLGFLLIS
jgi:hypothetical protein